MSFLGRKTNNAAHSKQVELENIQIHERIMGDDSFNGGITEVSEGYAFVITVIFIFGNRILFSV